MQRGSTDACAQGTKTPPPPCGGVAHLGPERRTELGEPETAVRLVEALAEAGAAHELVDEGGEEECGEEGERHQHQHRLHARATSQRRDTPRVIRITLENQVILENFLITAGDPWEQGDSRELVKKFWGAASGGEPLRETALH